ncbi:phage minor tail protein L [Mannheimia haemolytica]|uniref:phage minor tail protein L n=1 Tax=Mannheimia haemolytica TaxID=75985 RepID=UPI001F02F103|nr:phage minor tail protein L [Mannheimia haemolytica]ULX37729.1 phage minor tail protein L [Mannheimia haemolytica]ULX42573.1 phage minor tail protein L [Mannheimia haemolytica]ULX49242.1 phage minor tail protein L [Mannheimia haemolytica]
MPKAPQKMASELIKLEQDALIELWEIDLTHIYSSSNPNQRGEIFRFHNGVSQTQQNIWWQGNEYQAYPIAADGFEISGQGPSNRPTLTVSNLYGVVTVLVEDFGQPVEAKVSSEETVDGNIQMTVELLKKMDQIADQRYRRNQLNDLRTGGTLSK